MLDIETSPNKVYVWGLFKQNIALSQIEEPGQTLCWAAKWLGSRDTMFASLHADGKEPMLEAIYDLLEMSDVVTHYNGMKFDIPTLNQEFVSQGWGPPAPFIQIDLLRVVRKQFRLTSNKLDYVAQYLGLGAKTQHKGMALWRECMAGDDKAWEVMERYNKQDVALLEKLYERLRPWIPNHPNFGLFAADGKRHCPNCGGVKLVKRGSYYTAVLRYQRYRCSGCGAWSKDRFNDMSLDDRKNIVKGVT